MPESPRPSPSPARRAAPRIGASPSASADWPRPRLRLVRSAGREEPRRSASASAGSPGSRRDGARPRRERAPRKSLTMRSSSEWKVTTASRPPGFSSASAAAQAAQKLAELVVDGDSQRLERARRRMGELAPAGRRDARHQIRELQRRDERRRLAVGDDRAGDAARGALLAEMEQNVGDRRLVLFPQNVGGAAALRFPCACRGERRSAAKSRARPRRAASTRRRRRTRTRPPSRG